MSSSHPLFHRVGPDRYQVIGNNKAGESPAGRPVCGPSLYTTGAHLPWRNTGTFEHKGAP